VATCQRHIGAKQTDMLSINEKHLPCLRASLFFVVVDRGIKIVSLAPQAWQQRREIFERVSSRSPCKAAFQNVSSTLEFKKGLTNIDPTMLL